MTTKEMIDMVMQHPVSAYFHFITVPIGIAEELRIAIRDLWWDIRDFAQDFTGDTVRVIKSAACLVGIILGILTYPAYRIYRLVKCRGSIRREIKGTRKNRERSQFWRTEE